MSGFLARLVARAQGRVAMAQPLVPPRFAPGLSRRDPLEPGPVDPVEQTIFDDAAVAVPVAGEGGRAPALVARAPVPAVRPAPLLDEPVVAPAPRRTSRPNTLDAPAPSPVRWLVPRDEARPPASASPASAPPTITGPAIAQPERPSMAPRPAQPATAQAARPHAAALAADDRPPAITRQAPAPAAPAASAPVPARATLAQPPPALARAAARPARLAAPPTVRVPAARPSPAPPPAAPVVQIHIGRVEVRAVVPAPAAPRAAPPRPLVAVSLDEHLRRKDRR